MLHMILLVVGKDQNVIQIYKKQTVSACPGARYWLPHIPLSDVFSIWQTGSSTEGNIHLFFNMQHPWIFTCVYLLFSPSSFGHGCGLTAADTHFVTFFVNVNIFLPEYAILLYTGINSSLMFGKSLGVTESAFRSSLLMINWLYESRHATLPHNRTLTAFTNEKCW